ncbi:MAG: dihydrofolate synthase/folylpolyglutamate synthase [Psychromonas sp.]|jgi:dihydrofolate synthase/folylpolyglutamate synthase|uniref:bifunctional tetrahydrofolate synthase/dihydrofolate synthase n=1 Tax=Psychromonas sp. TaxID=1884585 RepID=UPI0039E243DA
MHNVSPQTLPQWLAYVEKLHPNVIELGLLRIGKVAKDLQVINFDAQVITVAGTNGKGTTCAFLEEILLQAGYKVGVYSSPHIQRYTERLRINKQELSEQAHCDAFAAIENIREETSLSYFEYVTLACLTLLKQAECDYILLEVGLGGRLDATNVVESDVTVITTIGIDHVDWLGSDREKIGFEKAGVFRANKPVICGEFDPPLSLQAHAKNLNCQIKYAGKDFSYQITGKQWHWSGKQKIKDIHLPLLPVQNASTALAVIEALQVNINPADLKNAIENASLAGRLQKISTTSACDLYLDVAHNPQSAKYLASQLRLMKADKPEQCKVHAIIGMLADKDMIGTFDQINAEIDFCNLVSLDCYRGVTADLLLQNYKKSKNAQTTAVCFENVNKAYETVLNKVDPSDIIIIFGSFHTVSDFLQG